MRHFPINIDWERYYHAKRTSVANWKIVERRLMRSSTQVFSILRRFCSLPSNEFRIFPSWKDVSEWELRKLLKACTLLFLFLFRNRRLSRVCRAWYFPFMRKLDFAFGAASSIISSIRRAKRKMSLYIDMLLTNMPAENWLLFALRQRKFMKYFLN